MTAIALSKAPGSPRPVRHGEALEGLSDAGQWVLDTLREWLRRSRARHELAGLGQRMVRDIEVTRAALIHLSNNVLERSDSHADDIDANPGATGSHFAPHRAGCRQMVLAGAQRDRAALREARDRPLGGLAALPAILSAG